jgi:Protein of unknown function (DUF2933)
MSTTRANKPDPRAAFLASRGGLVLLGFLVVIDVLLFTEHRAHVLGALLYLPLLLCPLRTSSCMKVTTVTEVMG